MGSRYVLKSIGGVEHKMCHGVTHPEGHWLPVTQFILRNARTVAGEVRYRGECKRCSSARRRANTRRQRRATDYAGYVNVDDFMFALRELENRLGRMEALRRVGVGKSTWYRWMKGDYKRMQAESGARVLRTLQQVRKLEIVRHKDSIHHGAYRRGRVEKQVTAKIHLYRRHGDADTQTRNIHISRLT